MELKNLHTEFLGQDFRYFETISSTQEYVKKLDEENKCVNGTVVFADMQTAGVGTHERKWYTGKGENIAFTFVLYPNSNLKKFDKLTIILAESMIEAVKKLYGYELQIKEPNDIVFLGRKMGGILTESISEGETLKKIFVGIGFNVNQEKFPGSLNNIATSLSAMFEGDFVREDILREFLEIFEEKYLELVKE